MFGINSADTEGGSILPGKEPTDSDLEKINDVEGGTVDPANVVALVFDQEAWGEIPAGLADECCHQTVEIESYDEPVPAVVLTSETGSSVMLTEKYVDGISELLGVDLQENPERIRMHSEDQFPVFIDDTKTDAEFVLAPRIPPEDF